MGRSGCLQTGDYSLAGLEHLVGIERKSLGDLVGCCTRGRDRFVRELERGRGLDLFAVIIEANMVDVAEHRYRSKAKPHSILQSLAAWQVRYGTTFLWAGSERGGAYWCHSLLSKYLSEQERRSRVVTVHLNEVIVYRKAGSSLQKQNRGHP